MADDSSGPPLSRRVPGATNRPKPKMRIAPPVLPEELVGRLRTNQAATAETTAAPPKSISGEVPTEPERQVAAVGEHSAEAPATWYVVPDSPASPVADGDDVTQPIPVIAATSEPRSPVKVIVDVRKEQLARRGGSQAAERAQAPERLRSADRPPPGQSGPPKPAAVAAPSRKPSPAQPPTTAFWRGWAARLSQAAPRLGPQ
jgi:hypothetical protein